MPVIDFHIHVGDLKEMQPWVQNYFQNYAKVSGVEEVVGKDGRMDPGALVSLLNRNGVDYAVILAELSPITTGITSNEFVSDFCRGHKELIPFASVNPFLNTHAGEEVERCTKELGMKGI